MPPHDNSMLASERFKSMRNPVVGGHDDLQMPLILLCHKRCQSDFISEA